MKQHLSKWLSPAREDAQRGAVMFVLAAAILVVMLGGALAVDLSLVSARAQELQNAADASALAGVQAYRQSDGDEAIAEAAVVAMLEQNGVAAGGDTTWVITYPDDENDTEVSVAVFDSDPGTLLTGVTGITSDVRRTATARFDSCSASCTINVEIPSPFRSVNAAGTGDGYKPIPVGHELYALNHNSSYGGIVCIDRNTVDDPDIEGQCAGFSSVSKPAYATGGNTQRNPEMPHTAVFDTKIYWTASDAAGTKLFCFETATATPCSTAYLLNDRERSNVGHDKDRNRGGGTALVDDKVFIFTDDWRVHCIVPDTGFGLAACPGYVGGLPSSLSLHPFNFPTNEPSDSNHGSSIDRVVDEANGKVYWTTHITSAGAAPADCSQDNQEFPNGLVSIQNVASGLFIRAGSSSSISESGTNTDDDTHWIAQAEGNDSDGNMRYSFRNVDRNRFLDSDSGNPAVLETSSSVSNDDKWTLGFQDTTSTLKSDYYGTYAQESGTDFVTANGLNGTYSDWVIRHPDCFDPGFVPGVPSLGYGAGTWLQCWNARTNAPCSEFTPSLVHTDGSRFSGRLFFHMDGAADPNIQGVCSTGFANSVATSNFELKCVSISDGLYDDALTTSLVSMENAIAGVTDDGPAAWGDPHYNEESNRLFYPTAHDRSRVVCFDFDYGMCGINQQTSSFGNIEDYGYFSEGDCVYGLGHRAYFYAFQAEDIYADCTGSTTRTHIEPCDCSGEWQWGTLTFDVDLAEFDEFFIQVENSLGEIVYPPPDPAFPDDPGHSLHDDGLVIDLNGLPVNGDPLNDFLEILVSVNSDSDPWAYGEQTFAVEFGRAPRLSD